MKNRVYGVLGIKAIRSNWNADFTGRPRTSASGEIISSDKAVKYAYRKYWSNDEQKVFYFRSLNENLNPRSLKERYESLFTPLSEVKTSREVLNNLFSCVDVMNFGATFAESKLNCSITGAVQIQQGINIYKDSEIETMDILSAFRNPSEKKDGSERAQTTIGEMVVADRVHYAFGFSVNPQNYNEFAFLDGFDGYTKEAYEAFKEASRVGVTALNSNTKAGCDNEFALFIELKEGSKAYLPNLVDGIRYIPGENDDKNCYDLTNLSFLEDIDTEIAAIEIYYDSYTTNVKMCLGALKNKTKEINMFTEKPINIIRLKTNKK
ncbi:type I CRISPR-associated protein Cas7 [Clostridium sp.]|jgi:CRISPR-associated protein Csh2|uniref:type I CRISPR-associated protein Cas7 n=1 Tax=Clostridium sp. TaxID=1506 RepID=UPI001A4F2E11|nr:type I CRISPR-associated protein Cas7 [Clostridium sp.]MBK5236436.1 type I CRISPR-associated protein Cas7 [Clostridium sp.]